MYEGHSVYLGTFCRVGWIDVEMQSNTQTCGRHLLDVCRNYIYIANRHCQYTPADRPDDLKDWFSHWMAGARRGENEEIARKRFQCWDEETRREELSAANNRQHLEPKRTRLPHNSLCLSDNLSLPGTTLVYRRAQNSPG